MICQKALETVICSLCIISKSIARRLTTMLCLKMPKTSQLVVANSKKLRCSAGMNGWTFFLIFHFFLLCFVIDVGFVGKSNKIEKWCETELNKHCIIEEISFKISEIVRFHPPFGSTFIFRSIINCKNFHKIAPNIDEMCKIPWIPWNWKFCKNWGRFMHANW